MPTEPLTCWNCGHENAAGSRFCAHCGKPQRATCPECGALAADDARFCANCGIPLQAAPAGRAEGGAVLTAEARKVVTVVFADLVGSTGLTERLDPEEARDVVGSFYNVVQHAVERFGGSVANLLGDAVLAVFGLPVAHEDDPERAVLAGLAIRDAMPVLNEHLAAAHGTHLATRVGVNTGEVVAASGSTFDRDFLISDAVTTAARLQQTVSAGQVVVGERTHRLTREVIEYRDLPPLEVKGKAAPLPVWEAVAPLPERADVRRMVAPLIGRHGELGLLRGFYERTRDDALVHLITIVGQPGVGKSRLLREFLAEVRDTQPRPVVLRGRSRAFGGQIGYHALIDIIQSQAGLMDTDPPDVVRTKAAGWLAEAGLADGSVLDNLLLTYGGTESAGLDPGEARKRLFDAWQRLVTAVAADRPTILAMEDVHWADDGLLDLVEWLAERVESAQLLIICLGRPDLLERRTAWAAAARNQYRMHLRPLRQQEVEQLVSSLSSRGVAADARRMIAERAGGNPLFAEELVRMLLEGSGPGAAIPDTVQAVLTARIDRLPPAERRALQAAAVVGATFWPSVVARLAGLTDDDATRTLDGLVEKELVQRRSASRIANEQEYGFRHSLTRDVAYGILPRAQRQRAHAEAARWLEDRLGDRVEESIEILAEHLRLAGDDARAATYLHRAAAKATRLYANADAIRLYAQALEAATRTRAADREIAALYLGRGEVHQLLGAYSEALADFERGRAAAQKAGERALEAVLEGRVGLIHHRQVRLDEAESHYARAADLAREAGDQRTLGLSLVDMANVRWDQGRVGPDDAALLEGIALLRAAGDPSSLARGLNLLCMAEFSAGNARLALAAAREALAVARGAGDKSREATSLSYLSVVSAFWDRFEDSVQFGRDAVALAEEIGDRRRIAFATSFVGRGLLSLGQWGEALTVLERALSLVYDVARMHIPFALAALASLYSELGAVDRANRMIAAAPNLRLQHPSWLEAFLVAHLQVARLNRDAARISATLDELQRLPSGVFIPDDGAGILVIGEGFIETGRYDDLRRYLDARRRHVEKFAAPSHLAGMALVDAQLAMLERKTPVASELLETALRHGQAASDVLTIRRALELRAAILGGDEDRRALRDLLRRLAASLPDGEREAFLTSPRAAVLTEEPPGP
jgi:predicted ATPase/class 3 adenylate cyclase